MKNKIVLITGATSGIGKETALGLAKLGATIVFTTRDSLKGEKTKKELIAATNNENIDMLKCNLASFESIKNCCKEFKSKYERIKRFVTLYENNLKQYYPGVKYVEIPIGSNNPHYYLFFTTRNKTGYKIMDGIIKNMRLKGSRSIDQYQ